MKKAEYDFVVRSIVEELVSFLMEDYKMPMLEAFDKIYNSHIFEKLPNLLANLHHRVHIVRIDDCRDVKLAGDILNKVVDNTFCLISAVVRSRLYTRIA